MPHSTKLLTTDEVEDLIYFSRAGGLDSLKEAIEAFGKTHSCTSYTVLLEAIDIDDEGLGSGSCLLHYPSANGNLEIVNYLLSIIQNPISDPQNGTLTTSQTSPSSKLINHQNVSGNTPLHWAGMNGHLAIVQALIKAGADPEIVNAAGRDAVVESEWSSKDGAADCAVWILSECGVLEKGVGEGVAGEGESSERVIAQDESQGQSAGEAGGSGEQSSI